MSGLNCVECFMRDGQPNRPAAFVINGQSVCQKHSPLVIRTRGQVAPTYTWVNDWEEPALMTTEGEQGPHPSRTDRSTP